MATLFATLRADPDLTTFDSMKRHLSLTRVVATRTPDSARTNVLADYRDRDQGREVRFRGDPKILKPLP
jgi:hypothetical protein